MIAGTRALTVALDRAQAFEHKRGPMPPSVGADGSHRRAKAAGVAVGLCGVALIALGLRVDRRWIEIHMTARYCAEQPGDLVHGTVLRWTAIAAGVFLLVVLRRAARWAERKTLGEMAGMVLSIVAATALALLVSDAVLRRKEHKAPGPSVLHYEPDSEGDPLLIYRPVPSHVTEVVVADRHLRFVIDANDWRVRSTEDVVDFARPTVIFTGESVASGFGLNFEETYPFDVGQDLGVQVVNVAVQSYGNDGAYVRMHEALPRFEHLVATVTMVNHFMIDRNVWADRPHVLVSDDGSLTVEPVQDESGWLARSPLLRLARNLVHSDEALRRARMYIAATARETRARGAFPLFVLANVHDQCLPDETGAPSIERNLFEGLNVDHVRVDLGEDTFDRVVWHPNGVAHRKIADAITQSLRARGIGVH